MRNQPRSHPPEIPNFRFVRYLGGGGFADVFLYDQLRPARPVAIKVLRSHARDPAAQRVFDDEADLMARVSAHPYIVTIYEADFAPDGRPFLVMEYYPRPNFGLRARQGPSPVHEVLQVGVRLASAVEAAHRAGILHRDIKPSNVLVSEYGRPGLTDFGIAGVSDGGGGGESQGVSFAYAAPEVVRGASPGDERSDIYSLAATLYTLLAGRSPFEVPGGDNSIAALARRVLSEPLPRVGRDEVGPSLELLLANSLARDPSQRPRSATDFGRSLQRIERELGHAPTEFELPDEDSSTDAREVPGWPDSDFDDGTRISGVQVVRQAPEPAPTSTSVISGLPTSFGAVKRQATIREIVPPPSPPDDPDTTPAIRPTTGSPSPVDEPEVPTRGRRARHSVLIGAAACLVLVVVAGAAIARSGSGGSRGPTSASTSIVDEQALEIPDTPPVPTDLSVVVSGDVATIEWRPGAGAEAGDRYSVDRTDRDVGPPVVTDETTVRFDVEPGASPCFEVSAQRGSRLSIESLRECAQS